MKKSFTLLEVLMAKGESGNKCLHLISRTNEPKEPTINTKFKVAFTLAEVLITLAIIGIVASATIPAVIQSYKRHVYSAKLKKFVNILQTIILKSRADGFTFKTLSRNQWGAADWYYYNKIIDYTLKYANIKTKKNNNTFVPNGEHYSDIFVLPDGSSFVYDTQWGVNLIIAYDVNGEQNKPNENGKDRFWFYYCPQESVYKNHCKKTDTLEPYRFADYGKTADDAKNGCKRGSFSYCPSYLWFNNFEFKSDYPWKL